jgi:hypothetical protein
MALPKVRAFIFGCYAAVLCLVAPSRFLAQAKVYDSKLPPQSEPEDQNVRLSKIVRRAFWWSFGFTVGSSALGYSLGLLLKCLGGPASPAAAKVVPVSQRWPRTSRYTRYARVGHPDLWWHYIG